MKNERASRQTASNQNKAEEKAIEDQIKEEERKEKRERIWNIDKSNHPRIRLILPIPKLVIYPHVLINSKALKSSIWHGNNNCYMGGTAASIMDEDSVLPIDLSLSISFFLTFAPYVSINLNLPDFYTSFSSQWNKTLAEINALNAF